FKRLSKDDVEAAVEGGASDWGINMTVDWAVFERLELFSRGEGMVTRTKKHPIFFWRKVPKKVDSYQRLVLLVKLRPHKRLPEHIDTEDLFTKLFKDIPKLDLEMILPGTSLQMPIMQKSKLGLSVMGSLGYAIYSLGTKLVAAVTAIFTTA